MSVTGMTPFKNKPLRGAVLAAAFVVALPAFGASDKARISADLDIQPLSTLSAQESQAVSLAAGRILLHTAEARLAIAAQDKKSALKEVDQGLTLVKVINNALPKYKVKTTIKSGDVTYSDEDEVSKRFVQVFNEQFVVDVIAPVVKAKNKSNRSHGQMRHRATAAQDYSWWRKATMKLDVITAADALALAKVELQKGNFDNADAALALLQTDGVVFEYSDVELPLAEAADNLKLAQLEVKEGKLDQAQETLKRASESLKKYERFSGENRTKEVEELNKQIEQMIESLAKGGQSDSALKKIGQDIASYWERVAKWFK